MGRAIISHVFTQAGCHTPPPAPADERDSRLMTPASWEEMADPADEYLQVGAGQWLGCLVLVG